MSSHLPPLQPRRRSASPARNRANPPPRRYSSASLSTVRQINSQSWVWCSPVQPLLCWNRLHAVIAGTERAVRKSHVAHYLSSPLKCMAFGAVCEIVCVCVQRAKKGASVKESAVKEEEEDDAADSDCTAPFELRLPRSTCRSGYLFKGCCRTHPCGLCVSEGACELIKL